MKNSYESAICSVADKLINDYRDYGRVYTGVNGPYDDPETTVRNLSHLIIIVCLHKTDSVERDELLRRMFCELKELIGEDGLYTMRNKPGKDHSNGVIGHAWLIESLVYLYRYTNEDTCLELAVKLANKHVFDKTNRLWRVPQEQSTGGAIDPTLNHQLWYAASLAELNNYVNSEDFAEQLETFIDFLPEACKNSKSGKVMHEIYYQKNALNVIKSAVKQIVNYSRETIGLSSMKYKEEGYHLFNIMAFARLYVIYPDAQIFKTSFMQKAIAYINSAKFFEGLHDNYYKKDISLHNSNISKVEQQVNIYGYPYNVPGFEIKFIAEVFKTNKDLCINGTVVERCFSEQIDLTYSDAEKLFIKMCHDKWAVNYRIYEYYKYLELKS